jgi:hypothetical protein
LASKVVFERSTTRSRCWVVLVGAFVLAGSTAFLTWWTTTLSGLPDVGDPFDVAAFAPPVPDEENAYTFYREAVTRLPAGPSGEMSFEWENAGAAEKGWLEGSRASLELWRQGTERSKALYVSPRSMTIVTPLPVIDRIRWLMRLAKLEAGRLEAEGDLDGAWQWYRAIFRCSRHVGFRATAIERLVGKAMHQVACVQMTRWASDQRVTPPLLRKALDAAIQDYAVTGPLSDQLKVEYIGFLNTYKDPDLVWKCLKDDAVGAPGKSDWLSRDVKLFSLARAFKKEPERSRRVIRLIYANLLAVCDLPPDRRPTVACSIPNLAGAPGPKTLVELYKLDASAPASARALAPEEVLKWYRTTLYASRCSPALLMIIRAIDAERQTQANLVIALANRLYEIERGKPPETYEDLVGPYLKALPDGYKPIR